MSELTFGSLFAGIGGFDLGLERSGMVCKWQVEIDPFCQRVLAKHWPNVRRYSDVRECGKHNLETVDVICGGFPCQPHSVAGKRRGAADDRNLWPEYLRIITELNPSWVIGENVSGIITTILDATLSDLEGTGYEVLPLVIPACAVNAPHRRDRVFMVANSDNDGCDPNKEEQEILGQASTESAGRAGKNSSRANYWTVQGRITWGNRSKICRVDDGIPNRVDRLRALGNAVVPQVAEWIGRQIIKAHSMTAE